MKLVSRDVSGKDGAGTVVLRPEEPEDMWHVYNLIGEGDLVRTTTFRKVRVLYAFVRGLPSL
jgi:protein pelota